MLFCQKSSTSVNSAVSVLDPDLKSDWNGPENLFPPRTFVTVIRPAFLQPSSRREDWKLANNCQTGKGPVMTSWRGDVPLLPSGLIGTSPLSKRLNPPHGHLPDCFNNPGEPASNKQVAELTNRKTLSTFLDTAESNSVQIVSQDCPLDLPRRNLTLSDFVCQVAGRFLSVALQMILCRLYPRTVYPKQGRWTAIGRCNRVEE